MLQRVLPPSQVFAETDTKHKLDAFLQERCGMIMPSPEYLGEAPKWIYKPKPDVISEKHYFYYVSITEKLKRLLSIDAIRDMVDFPERGKENFLTTVLHGSYHETNPFFKENPKALAIIFYYDDLGVSNVLRGNATSQKLSVFYWTLGNIAPYARSNLNLIFLLGIVKTKFLKRYGLHAVLKPFIQEILTLQSTGVEVVVNGQSKMYKGSVYFFSGDTPAAAMVCGCKESVSANKPCRTCLTDHTQMTTSFDEASFQIRTVEMHSEHLRILSDPELSPQERKFWQRFYGVNSASPLLQIPHCDVLRCCVQDVMHILLEGCVEVECRLLLLHCTSNAVFSLGQLNSRMESFNYGYFGKDRPAAITPLHLRNGLKQTAAQMLTLSFCLPFLICNWIRDCNDDATEERYQCFIKLVQIVNLTLAYEIRIEDTVNLSKMIESHHRLFAELYPDKMTPKFHFLIHVPRQIREFGPVRQTWCMRFEAAHAPKKSLVSVVKSFRNMAKTLAYRSEALSCVSAKAAPSFLHQGDRVSPGTTVLLEDLPSQEKIHQILQVPPGAKLLKSDRVVYKGASFEKNDVILLNDGVDNDELPSFGLVRGIYVYREKKLICFNPVKTVCFDEYLNSYRIESSFSEADFVLLQDIVFPHRLPVYVFEKCRYVVLLFHWRSEFYG